jgi:hypothetical protein
VVSLIDEKAQDVAYIVVFQEDGKTTVTFGDGKKGARPQSGNDSVRAVYRESSGKAGNVSYNQTVGEVFSNGKKAIESLGKRITSNLMKLTDGKGTYVIYLDVWKREENPQDDANVRETAQEDTNIGKRSENSGKLVNKGRRIAEKK